jgi:alkylation response protein AidB-like acyl-CoA dehydrogenase
MESIESMLVDYQNKTEFPFQIIDGIRKLGVNGFHIKEFGGPGLNTMEVGAIIYEMAKIDASVYTFLTVHNSIGMAVVDYLGSEEQRARILPDGIALKKILSFGLTEPLYGSDATSLRTSAKKVEGGYIINGEKRWIGNATFADYIIVWARNLDEGEKIQAFLVEKGSKGLTTKKIENKYSLRIVQNADIKLENVFVPDNNRLEKAKDFATGTNKILEHSRIKVCWGAVGIAAGAYEAALRYTMNRKQFGKPIAAFQLSQLKLSKMLAIVESMLTIVTRISQLYD